jgi:succinoglycan biosynthesis protein ExoV
VPIIEALFDKVSDSGVDSNAQDQILFQCEAGVMRLFYWSATTNFGDFINGWMWPQLLEGFLSDSDGIRLVGVGSLLKSSLNRVAGTKVVFGTGSGYGTIPRPEHRTDWRFYFVRGPRTAAAFNLDPSVAIVDGSWMIGLLPKSTPISPRRGTAFIPHWTSVENGNWGRVCEQAGFRLVNPLGDLGEILKTLQESELVITESLHGAILADLFRTPWIPVSLSPHFLPFKWLDWCESVLVDVPIRQLPLSDAFEYVRAVRWRRDDEWSDRFVDMSLVDRPLLEERQIPRGGRIYKFGSRARVVLREGRGRAIAALEPFRDNILIRGWNARHRDRLAEVLRKVALERPALSTDAVHAEKLERLSAVLDRLKSDYSQGKIHS